MQKMHEKLHSRTSCFSLVFGLRFALPFARSVAQRSRSGSCQARCNQSSLVPACGGLRLVKPCLGSVPASLDFVFYISVPYFSSRDYRRARCLWGRRWRRGRWWCRLFWSLCFWHFIVPVMSEFCTDEVPASVPMIHRIENLANHSP